MKEIGAQVATIAVAIIGLATLAVLVSRNANTAQVIGVTGTTFSDALMAAVSPVTQGSNH